MKDRLFEYILQLGDSPMILGQRLGEWCGHGPILEIDMALTNISLDLFGQTRNYFQYAAQVEGKDRTEDQLAFLRTDREYKNYLLVEQPNGDFAQTIARQFYFDAFHLLFLKELAKSTDEQLAAIAAKSVKEVTYHIRFSSDWVVRLGDGTEESKAKISKALYDLWDYTGELFAMTDLEKEMHEAGIGVNTEAFRPAFEQHVKEVCDRALLVMPDFVPSQKGGKEGMHSEHLGHLLSDMQYMQRVYPNMEW